MYCVILAYGDIFSVLFVVLFWYWTKLSKACLTYRFYIYKSSFQPQVKSSICCFYAQITLFILYFWYYFNFIYDSVKHRSCEQNPKRKEGKEWFWMYMYLPTLLVKRHAVYFYTILRKHVTPEDSIFCDPGDIIWTILVEVYYTLLHTFFYIF